MEPTQIYLELNRRITIKNARGDYDSTEVKVGFTGKLSPEDDPTTALVEASIIVRQHIEKELEVAASEKSQVVVSLIQQKEATGHAAAPQPAPIQQQQFTRKPLPAARDPRACLDCGKDKGNSTGPRCKECYLAWRDGPQGRR